MKIHAAQAPDECGPLGRRGGGDFLSHPTGMARASRPGPCACPGCPPATLIFSLDFTSSSGFTCPKQPSLSFSKPTLSQRPPSRNSGTVLDTPPTPLCPPIRAVVKPHLQITSHLHPHCHLPAASPGPPDLRVRAQPQPGLCVHKLVHNGWTPPPITAGVHHEAKGRGWEWAPGSILALKAPS